MPNNGKPWTWPLYLRVLLGVFVGTAIGLAFGTGPIVAGWTTADLGALAASYIQLLTTLATPLIFLAIIEAFVQTDISGRQGAKLMAVCAMNVAVAFVIGLTILNVWQPGRHWRGTLEERSQRLAKQESRSDGPAIGPAEPRTSTSSDRKLRELSEKARSVSLSPLEMLRGYVPKSIAQPFVENMVLTVAAMAICVGAALRGLKATAGPELAAALPVFEGVVVVAYQIVLRILGWLIALAPWAICFAVAGVIGATGSAVFPLVGVFFLTVAASLGMHAIVYYPLSAWLLGGVAPRRYWGEGAAAILTGFSINSSLATAPLTLDALRRLGVSESSARLSACVGTNFNNDGITLYEAITALFIAQAAGLELTASAQVVVLVAALAGSMGIAGIPNSGLIILALVLKAARLPDDVVQLALPIVYSIDFILARLRSAVNVMGDLQVAIVLDGRRDAPASDAAGDTASDSRPAS